VVGETGGPDAVAAEFGADGRAVVAWQENYGEAVGAAVRDPATGFGPGIVIVPAPMTGPSFGTNFRDLGPEPLPLFGASVAPDGRARVVWQDGNRIRTATLSGSAVLERRRLGGALGSPEGISLTTRTDGRAALAWTNDRGYHEGGPGRVHVAVEGAGRRPQPAAPRVTIGRVRPLALRPSQALVVPVRCSAACDLAVSVSGRGFPVTRSLTRAGRLDVRIHPAGRPLVPAGGGDLRIVVRASAPGASKVARATKTVRLNRRPALPLPRLAGVRARRLDGGKVEVRWRTTGPARETVLVVEGKRTRRSESDVLDAVLGTRRRSYRLVLEYASRARWISVQIAPLVGRERHTVHVRLDG
jgi:hypothetical protein